MPEASSSLFESDHSSEKDPPKHRLLTENELVSGALNQFSRKIDHGDFTQEQVEGFVKERVTGVKVNNVNVISIDIRPEDKELDPLTKAYMSSDDTRVNIVEYFEPELKINKLYHLMRPIKTFRNYRRNIRGEKQIAYNSSIAGLKYAEMIKEQCKEAGKPVAVMDIADRASFGVAWQGLRYAGLPLIDVVPHNAALATAVAAGAWSVYLGLYQSILGRGMYDKEKVTKFDKFVLDFEQARRLYLAKGVEQLTKDIKPKGEEEPQIVSLYPRAHGIRMADILVNPHPMTDKIKSGIYKTVAPWLNYAIRTWEYVGLDKKDSERLSVNGWVRTGKQRITM